MDFDIVPFEDIVWGQRIGGGSFGSIYRGQYLGIDIAIKEIHPSTQYDVRKYFEREWRIMRECRHPNIVLFLGLCKEPGANGRVFICSEYVEGGNLRALIRAKNDPFPWHQRLKYSLDLTKAMAYLHSRNCLHRDLKGENLLLTTEGSLKVTDFGFARIASRNLDEMRHMTYCGTDGYMSPEIVMGEDFDLPTDVYSMGIIFLELCTRTLISSRIYHPESKKRPPVFVPDRQQLLRHLDTGCPLDFFELALDCLSFQAADRPVVTEVLDRLMVMYTTCLSMMDDSDEPMAVEEAQSATPNLALQNRKGKRRAMPVFEEDMSSEQAEKEVELEVGGFSDSSSSSDEEEEPRRGRQREQKQIQVIAKTKIRIEGDGAVRRRRTRRRTVTQEWLDSQTRTRSSSPSMKSCNQGYVTAESNTESEDTARRRLLDSQVSTAVPASPTSETTLSAPVDELMPCGYPPSPPAEMCSTLTVRRVVEEVPAPVPASTSPRPLRPPLVPRRSSRPTPIQVPQSPQSIVTSLPSPNTPDTPQFPQPLQLQQSLAHLTRRQSAKQTTPLPPTTTRNLVQHKFTISAKSQTTMAAVLQGTKRIPSTLVSVPPNWANFFYSSSSSRNKCKVCSKKLGLNYLQCNECHALIHAKCKSAEYNFLCTAFPAQQLDPDP